MIRTTSLFTVLMLIGGVNSCWAAVSVDRLRCEYMNNPLGIDAPQPRLNWGLQSDQRGQRQTAYQVLVASTPELLANDQGDLWDSGRVQSDAIFNIVYAGKPLPSCQTCYWKVRAWDRGGQASEWSKPASWTMGLLREEDWKNAQWIGIDAPMRPYPTGVESPEGQRLAARHLRHEFEVGKEIRSAKVSFCGLGVSELYLNGKKVGDEVLSPPLAEYGQRAYYVTYDVTGWLKTGRNALGVWLGNGRYWAPRLKYPQPSRTFGPPKLRLVMRIEYVDGTVQDVVSSNEGWWATDQGPIRANNEYDGEEYNARMELPGWADAGYHNAGWHPPHILPGPGGALCGRRIAPIRVIETRKPIARTNPKPGVYVFDMGQNMVGWCRLRAEMIGPPAKNLYDWKVKLRFAETLQPDGTLYVANLRTGLAENTYTLKGDGPEVYEPRFTYFGFRYVEITNYPGEPALDTIEGCVVHDDLEPAGDFSCSHELLNRLHENCRWTIRGNYRSIPTDCPQRDEKQGWLGDRAFGCRGEMQLFDAAAFYEKWLTDIADTQRPDGAVCDTAPSYWPFYFDTVTWPGTICLIPNVLREQYGDERFVAEHYPAMRRWVEHMLGFMADDRIPRDIYGDWLVPPEDIKLIHSVDPAQKTNGELLATAYFYRILRLMSEYAVLAKNPEDAARYAALAARIKESFNRHFFKPETAQYDNGTQTSSLLPLSFGLTPDDQRARVFEQLAAKIEVESKSHVGVGLVGIQHLLRVLCDNGRPDLAFRIATQEDYPGWGYVVGRGATTVWELWNGDTASPDMNSGNHVALIGDLLSWMYEYLAGIRPDPTAPGYRKIILKPELDAGLDSVSAWRHTISGRIESQWRRENGRFTWDVLIPTGVKATVYLPATSTEAVRENGKPIGDAQGVAFLRMEGSTAVFEVDSGRYRFEVEAE